MTIEQLESLLSVRPHSPLFARLASEYLKRGLSQEARQLCEAGIAHHPHYAAAHVVLAKTFFDLGEASAARESLTRAMTLVPDSELLAELDAQWSHSVEANMDQREEYVRPDVLIETEASETTELPPQTVDDFDSRVPESSGQIVVTENFTPTLEEEMFIDTASHSDSVQKTAAASKDFLDAETHTDSSIEQHLVESTLVDVEPVALDSGTQLILGTEDKSEESQSGDVPEHPTSWPHESDERQDLIENVAPSAETLEIEPPQATRHVPNEGLEQNGGITPSPQKLHGSVSNEEGRIVSKTLAEIYARQGAHAEAIITYELLKQVRPDESAEFDQRIRELEQKLQEKAG